ncbi:MAG: polyphenol oxidase family protein [Leptospiraceae bacterium]|nr:polyphenol oxidase family protein [Leptospiraceae bacterium]
MKKFQTEYGKIHIQILGQSDWKIDNNSKMENTQFIGIRDFIHNAVNHPHDKMYSARQVHGGRILNSSELQSNTEEEGDGLCSYHTSHLLYIKTADCLPLFFWSDTNPVFGVLHIGWKGASLHFVEDFFLKMKIEMPEISFWNILFGPSISMKNYTVQEDVAVYFQDGVNSLQKFTDGFKLGVKEYVNEKLENLPCSFHFYDLGICTYEDNNFFSHRRKCLGRNLNLIWTT